MSAGETLRRSAMLAALSDDSSWVRMSALEALIAVPRLTRADISTIRALKHDTDPMVRERVEVTLRNIRLRRDPAA